MRPCECSDPGCPVHPGSERCTRRRVVTVYRVDMEDRTGTDMCQECGEDALNAGVFTTERPQ